MTIRGILGTGLLLSLLLWAGPQAAVAAALSERAESARDSWLEILSSPASPLRMEGKLEVVERPDGSLHMVMPDVVLRDPSWDEEGLDAMVLELGTIQATLRPVAEERWATVWEIPGEMPLRDGLGNTVGVLQIEERIFSGLWAEDLQTLLAADLRLGGLAFTLDADVLREAMGEDDVANGEAVPQRISARQLAFSLDLQESDPGVVSGPLTLTLDGVRLEGLAGDSLASLGSLRVGVEYREVDLPAISGLADLAADPEALMERNPEALLADVLAALGGFETTLEVLDLRGDEPGGGGSFQLDSVRLESGFVPSADGTLERDFWIGAQGRDWRFADAGGAHELAGFGMNLRLDRIAPETLLQLGLLSLMADELPAHELAGLSQEILGSLALGLSFQGIGGRLGPEGPAATVYGLDLLEFGLSLLDLDSHAPGLALSYRQQGLTALSEGMLPVPAEFVPRAVVLDLEASGLPAGSLLDGGGAGADVEPGDVFIAMLENRTRLDVHEILIDLPIAGLRMNGQVRVDDADGDDPPVLRSRTELEIRNLDTLIEYALAFSPTDEVRQQVVGAATILKLAAEQRSGPDGEAIHYLLVEASSEGELLINGTDLAPLLMGGGF